MVRNIETQENVTKYRSLEKQHETQKPGKTVRNKETWKNVTKYRNLEKR